MSFNLLFEMAAVIGTQRMVELCEHYLWVTDTNRKESLGPSAASLSPAPSPPPQLAGLDASGAVLPPIWRDCSGQALATPDRPIRPLACPGAPRRQQFNSPHLGALGPAPSAVVRALDLSGNAPMAETLSELSPAERLASVLRHLENYYIPPGSTRKELLSELRALDPIHPLLCPLHDCRVRGGPSLGYSRNSSGNYSMFSPSCIGCPVGESDAAEE
jgi:hypothetical protein